MYYNLNIILYINLNPLKFFYEKNPLKIFYNILLKMILFMFKL